MNELYLPEKCLRGRNCQPLSQLAASENDFICCGLNDPEDRKIPGDIFTLCIKSSAGVNNIENCDRGDLLDEVAVISQALMVKRHMDLE